jgi:hypothetical protein
MALYTGSDGGFRVLSCYIWKSIVIFLREMVIQDGAAKSGPTKMACCYEYLATFRTYWHSWDGHREYCILSRSSHSAASQPPTPGDRCESRSRAAHRVCLLNTIPDTCTLSSAPPILSQTESAARSIHYLSLLNSNNSLEGRTAGHLMGDKIRVQTVSTAESSFLFVSTSAIGRSMR